MSTPPRLHLTLAVHGMPAEARALLLEVAQVHGWPTRLDDQLPPRLMDGEVLVAMAPVWLALEGSSPSPRRRGLCLLSGASACEANPPGSVTGVADVVQPWPCEASRLAHHLTQLMAPLPLSLNLPVRTVTHRGRHVRLTPKECRILQLLVANAGHAVARDQLEATLHEWGQDFGSNTLDVHVHRLRRKLPAVGIRAVRGYGYVLIASGADQPADTD